MQALDRVSISGGSEWLEAHEHGLKGSAKVLLRSAPLNTKCRWIYPTRFLFDMRVRVTSVNPQVNTALAPPQSLEGREPHN